MEDNQLLIDRDCEPHSIIHELIHVISSKKEPNLNLIGLQRQEIDTTSGKEVITNYNIGLNEAITEMLANQISGGFKQNPETYLVEQNILQQLFLIVDKDSVIDCYFNNDLNKFKELFYNKGLSYGQVEYIINAMDTLVLKKEGITEELLFEVQKIIYDNIKDDKDKKQQFNNLVIDRQKVEKYLYNDINQYNLDNMGYRDLDKIHEYISKEDKNLDSIMVPKVKEKTKKEEVIDQMQEVKNAMLERIKNGKVVKEMISKDDVYGDDKVVITQTETGTYGYQIFAPGSITPYYVAEAACYFDDISKRTASDGTFLRYTGAKSAISRNLVGPFLEHRTEDQRSDFYVCFKSPEDAQTQMKQRMAGGYKQDAIVLIDVDLNKRTIAMPTDIQTPIINGVPTFNVGISPDWTDEMFVDFEKALERAAETEAARRFFGEETMTPSELRRTVKEETRNAYSFMAETFDYLGVPMLDEVERKNIFSTPGLYGEQFKNNIPSFALIPSSTETSKTPQSSNDEIKELLSENEKINAELLAELQERGSGQIDQGEKE
jgi:FPC/CPF motif-containing protein YcgG